MDEIIFGRFRFNNALLLISIAFNLDRIRLTWKCMPSAGHAFGFTIIGMIGMHKVSAKFKSFKHVSLVKYFWVMQQMSTCDAVLLTGWIYL